MLGRDELSPLPCLGASSRFLGTSLVGFLEALRWTVCLPSLRQGLSHPFSSCSLTQDPCMVFFN